MRWHKINATIAHNNKYCNSIHTSVPPSLTRSTRQADSLPLLASVVAYSPQNTHTHTAKQTGLHASAFVIAAALAFDTFLLHISLKLLKNSLSTRCCMPQSCRCALIANICMYACVCVRAFVAIVARVVCFIVSVMFSWKNHLLFACVCMCVCVYFTSRLFYSHFTALFLINLRPRGASQLKIAPNDGRLCCLPTSFTNCIHTYIHICAYITATGWARWLRSVPRCVLLSSVCEKCQKS